MGRFGIETAPAKRKWSAFRGRDGCKVDFEENPFVAKLNIKPLGDKIIVQRTEAEGTTAGGIVLPDSAKEKPKRGIVLAVGNGRLLDDGSRAPMQVKVKDEVVFTSYAGNEIKVGPEEYLIMDESDVLGVLR